MMQQEYRRALATLRKPAPTTSTNSPFEGFTWRSVRQRNGVAPCLACASRSRVAQHSCSS